MTSAIPSCINCKHFIKPWKCLAFKERIPAEIAKGINEHKEPYPGDNDIQFETTDNKNETD